MNASKSKKNPPKPIYTPYFCPESKKISDALLLSAQIKNSQINLENSLSLLMNAKSSTLKIGLKKLTLVKIHF